MQGPAHLALGWLMGERAGLSARRDRRIVGLAGLVPDVDVLSYPLAYLWYAGDIDRAHALYAVVHHRYTHGLAFAVLAALVAYRLATPALRGRVAVLTFAAVLVHIGADLVASGPGWPVYPLWPVGDLAWSVPWSIQASDWRNVALSLSAIAMTLAYAWRCGYSPVECFSYRADAWVSAVLGGEARSTVRFRVVLYLTLALVTLAVTVPLLLYLR